MSNLIRKARETVGLRQIDLARLLEVTQATLSNWERGEYEPDHGSLLALSKHLNVTVDYLLGNTEKPNAIVVPADPEEIAAERAELAREKKYKQSRISDTSPDIIENAPTHGGGDLSLSLDAMLDMLKNEEGIMFDGMDYSEEAITLLYQSIMNVKETARMLAERDKGKQDENSKPGEDN